jgi:hypothetical protein
MRAALTALTWLMYALFALTWLWLWRLTCRLRSLQEWLLTVRWPRREPPAEES